MPQRWRIFTDHQTTTLAVKVEIKASLHAPVLMVTNLGDHIHGGAWRSLGKRVRLPEGELTFPTVSVQGIWHSYTIPVEPTMPGVALLAGPTLPEGITLSEDIKLRVIPQYGKHPWFK